jgi:hypothetical protein
VVHCSDYRGVPYAAEFEIGKYHKPNVVTTIGQRYHQETGQPLLSEKILSGQKLIYDTETEITDKNRKKLIDSIIGDNHPESIRFYYQELGVGNLEQKSDETFSYEDFVNLSIQETRNLSAKSGGSRTPGYHRDKDGKLRDKNDNLV